MRLLLLLACLSSLQGQTPALWISGTSLNWNPNGSSVAAIEWTIIGVPAGLTVTIGPAGMSAQKTVQCASVSTTMKCVVSGENNTPIAAGVLVTLNVSGTSQPSNGITATPDGMAAPIPAVTLPPSAFAFTNSQ